MIVFYKTKVVTDSSSIIDPAPQIVSATASKNQVEYINLCVPNINSSFKTYMDYRAITNKNSP